MKFFPEKLFCVEMKLDHPNDGTQFRVQRLDYVLSFSDNIWEVISIHDDISEAAEHMNFIYNQYLINE